MTTPKRYGELIVLVSLFFICLSSSCIPCLVNRKPYEPLYIATDENYKPWFDDFKNQHSGPLRYLSDYKDLIGLDDLDITVYGLVDTLVASRGSMFAGTWFSTFR